MEHILIINRIDKKNMRIAVIGSGIIGYLASLYLSENRSKFKLILLNAL